MPEIDDSILRSVKRAINAPSDAIDELDRPIIMAINTALSVLAQHGVRKDDGYQITGYDESWKDYLQDDVNLGMVQSYVELQTRMLFDPPTSSAAMQANKEILDNLAWRIQAAMETKGDE